MEIKRESSRCSGLPGTVQMLSTLPTVDWVVLGSGESNKGKDIGSLYIQLVCGRILPLARKSL